LSPAAERSGVVVLEAGFRPVTIRYFNKTGGEELKVFWRTPVLCPQSDMR